MATSDGVGRARWNRTRNMPMLICDLTLTGLSMLGGVGGAGLGRVSIMYF